MTAKSATKRAILRLRATASAIEVTTILITAAAGCGSLIAICTAYMPSNRVMIFTAAIILTPTVVVATCVWHFVTHHYTPKLYEILEMRGELEIHRVQNHRRYVYTRSQRIRANRDEVRLVEFREYWTGKGSRGSMRVSSVISDHILFDGETQEEDGRVRRWIYLSEPLRRGQEKEVALQQIHDDDVQRQLPFFRQGSADYVAHRLSVVVRFPICDDPPKIAGVTWNTYQPLKFHKSISTLLCRRTPNGDGTVSYSITIDRPKRYHSYGMRWTWNDEQCAEWSTRSRYTQAASLPLDSPTDDHGQLPRLLES